MPSLLQFLIHVTSEVHFYCTWLEAFLLPLLLHVSHRVAFIVVERSLNIKRQVSGVKMQVVHSRKKVNNELSYNISCLKYVYISIQARG